MPGPATVEDGTRVDAVAWRLRRRALSLREPVLMGILNVTPDSFSDGGLHRSPGAAVRRAVRMVEEGADIIDVGGESTRPGAQEVPVAEEIARVVPIIRALRTELSVPLSIDTRKAEVARAALEAGAEIVNDVSALGDPEMGPVVAGEEAGLVLMHMRGTPATMQRSPSYGDVAAEVRDELAQALRRARDAGVEVERIVVDPGIGFAKDLGHNLRMLADLRVLHELGRPVLLGVSRKAFIGTLLGVVAAAERAVGGAAACVVGLMAGARIFRVHDVKVAREALVVAEAIRAVGAEAA